MPEKIPVKTMEEKLQTIITSYPNSKREDLIPILQKIQEEFNYLPQEAIYAVSKELEMPASKVYSIASFYNLFRFQAIGKYHIRVCNGTACHLSKSSDLLREIKKELKIESGHATNNGLFSLETVPCMGACHLSPVVRINNTYHTKVDSDQIKSIIDEIKKEEDL